MSSEVRAGTDLIAVNANDPQLAQLDLLVKSLRDPLRGDFQGVLLLVTTGVSEPVRAHFAKNRVEVFASEVPDFPTWEFAPVIGAYEFLKKQPATWRRSEAWRVWRGIRNFWVKRWGYRFLRRWEERQLTRRALSLGRQSQDRDRWRAEFGRYLLKHFTKFNLLPALAARGEPDSTRVMLLDSDIMAQGPVARIFERITPSRCLVEFEKEALVGNNRIARSNRLARGLPGSEHLRFGADAHELNVGFMAATAGTLRELMVRWRRRIMDPAWARMFVVHSNDCWHEQDFFRLMHDQQPGRFDAVGKDLVYHAVTEAAQDLTECGPLDYRRVDSRTRPVLVHFAGGFWRGFPSMQRAYAASAEEIQSRAPRLIRTILFGTGADAEVALNHGYPDEFLVAVVDNDPAKHGKTIHDYTIAKPAVIKELAHDRIRIASGAVAAIHRQLRNMGIPAEKLMAPALEPDNRRKLASLHGAHPGRAALVLGEAHVLSTEEWGRLAGWSGVKLAVERTFTNYRRSPFVPDYHVLERLVRTAEDAEAFAELPDCTKLLPEIALRHVKPDERCVLNWLVYPDRPQAPVAYSMDPLEFPYLNTAVGTAILWAFWFGCSPVYLVGVEPDALARLQGLPAFAERIGHAVFNATRGADPALFPTRDFDSIWNATAEQP